MDRLSSEATELLRRYRAERPGAGRAKANYRVVTARLEAHTPATSPRTDDWRRQLGWGLAAAAAAALLLVLVDAVLPAPKSAEVGAPALAPSEALDHAQSVEREGAAVKGAPVPSEPKTPTEPAPDVAKTPQPSAPLRRVEDSASSVPSGPEALAEEARLLRLAREGLRRGDLTAARSALDEHARQFPKGALAEDRAAYDVVLRCRVGAPHAASTLAAFKRAYPRSPHSPRLAEACEDR